MADTQTNEVLANISQYAAPQETSPTETQTPMTNGGVEDILKLMSEHGAPPPHHTALEPIVTPASMAEKKTTPEYPTTTSGMIGAIARGVAPTAITAGLGAIAGLPVGEPLQGAKAGAGVPAYGDMMVNSLNAVLKTHYTTPSDAITHLLDKAGFEEPRSHAEKIAYQFSRGGAEAAGAATSAGGAGEAAYLANSPVAKGILATLGKAPVEQAVAGAGLQGGAEAVKEAGGGTSEQVGLPIAALLVGGGARAIPSLLQKGLQGIVPTIVEAYRGDANAQKSLANAAASDPRLAQAAKKLGLQNLSPEFLSKNPQYQTAAQVVASTPESKLASIQKQSMEQISQQAEKLISDLGGTTDLSTLNQNVRSSMIDSKKKLEDQANLLYGVINEGGFNKQARTPALETMKAIREKLNNLGGDVSGLSSLERRIMDTLSPKNGLMNGKNMILHPTYEMVDTIRREIGDAIRQTGPFKDEVSGNAKYYYGKLSDDLNKELENQNFGKTAQMAKQSVATRKQLEDKITELFGNEVDKNMTDSLKIGMSSLAGGNADKFINIMNNVPPDLRQQVAVSGLASAFGKQGNLNFNTYSKWYEGLKKNQVAYNALVQNLPKSAAEQMENLYLISKNVNNALQKQVRTGLISSSAFNSVPEKLTTQIRDIGRRAAYGAAIGVPVSAIGHAVGAGHLANEIGSLLSLAVAGAAGGKTKSNALQLADAYLTSPDFAKLVAASQSSPTKFAQAARTAASKPVFQRFAEAAGIPVAQRANFFINMATQPDQDLQKTNKSDTTNL